MKPARSFGTFSLIQSLESRTLFSTLPPILTPGGFTAKATSASTVRLGWIDRSVNETGFAIERSSDGATFNLVIVAPPGAIKWNDTGLDPDTTYTYRLYAFNNTDTSSFAPLAIVVTPPTSFADRDNNGTLFVHANTGVDIVTITDHDNPNPNLSTIDVDVNGAVASFNKVSEPISRISLITFNGDHTINVDESQALTLKGNAQVSDIIGLTGDDTVLNVKINGTATTFSRTLVSRVNIFTYLGDDRISVGADLGAVNVSGGDGSDTIFTSNGDDRIDGGRGNDSIKAGDGNDVVKGGSGNDIIYGQNGDDTLFGNDGDDKLVGGDGIDSIEGNDGKDRLYGGIGQDILKGGNGKDSVFQDDTF